MAHRPTLLFAALVIACARAASAQEAPPAHVAFMEGSATIERDGVVELLSSGVPLIAGDRLETTTGRVEVLFGGGSALFLDESSLLDLLSPNSLRLLTGRLTFDVLPGQSGSATLYQVDTPAGSVFLTAAGEYNIVGREEPPFFSTQVQVARGAADVVGDTGRISLTSGEESLVRTGAPPAFPLRFNSARWDAFGQWVELRRADHRNLNASQPLLPPAVQTYAATLDRYGSWSTDTQYGIVWYPTVGGGWRPYSNGRWAWVAPFGWTWVGAEAWGWPTEHYGRWCTNAAGSWFWIPGTEWGRAASVILRPRGAERPRDEHPRRSREQPRSAALAPVSPMPAPTPPPAPAVTRAPHDPLVRAMPRIGLPLPTLGLPPAPRTTVPTRPSFGAASGMPRQVGPGVQPRAAAPPPAGTATRTPHAPAGSPPSPPQAGAGPSHPPRAASMPKPGWAPARSAP
jgi:Family of unknown function (DUF6600)